MSRRHRGMVLADRINFFDQRVSFADRERAALAVGWRPGAYTAEEAASIGIAEARCLASVHKVPKSPYLLTTIVVRHDDPSLSDPGLSRIMALCGWDHLPGFEAPISLDLLLARIWKRRHPLPCLTLRRNLAGSVPDSIVMEGLEELPPFQEVDDLVRCVRFLAYFSAKGRPSLSARDDWRKKALRSFELERESPKPTLEELAMKLWTSKATLCRWRARLRAEGVAQR